MGAHTDIVKILQSSLDTLAAMAEATRLVREVNLLGKSMTYTTRDHRQFSVKLKEVRPVTTTWHYPDSKTKRAPRRFHCSSCKTTIERGFSYVHMNHGRYCYSCSLEFKKEK